MDHRSDAAASAGRLSLRHDRPAPPARGIDALKLYRAEVDERHADPSGTPLLKPQPVHDWTSHRYLALTLDRQATQTGFYRRIEYASEGAV